MNYFCAMGVPWECRGSAAGPPPGRHKSAMGCTTSVCHGSAIRGSVEKPNLEESASRTQMYHWGAQTYHWGYAIRMPWVRYGSAADPLRLCYGHAMDVPRTRIDEICSYYGYAMDMPWRSVPWDFGYCTALTCDGGTANVLWMCYACANRLPIMCYRGIYMDPGSVEKPNLPECVSRTQTYHWGKQTFHWRHAILMLRRVWVESALGLPWVRYWAAMGPQNFRCG